MGFVIEVNIGENTQFYEPVTGVADVVDVAGYFIFAENSHDVQTKLFEIGRAISDSCDTSSKTPNTHEPMKKDALRGDP